MVVSLRQQTEGRGLKEETKPIKDQPIARYTVRSRQLLQGNTGSPDDKLTPAKTANLRLRPKSSKFDLHDLVDITDGQIVPQDSHSFRLFEPIGGRFVLSLPRVASCGCGFFPSSKTGITTLNNIPGCENGQCAYRWKRGLENSLKPIVREPSWGSIDGVCSSSVGASEHGDRLDYSSSDCITVSSSSVSSLPLENQHDHNTDPCVTRSDTFSSIPSSALSTTEAGANIQADIQASSARLDLPRHKAGFHMELSPADSSETLDDDGTTNLPSDLVIDQELTDKLLHVGYLNVDPDDYSSCSPHRSSAPSSSAYQGGAGSSSFNGSTRGSHATSTGYQASNVGGSRPRDDNPDDDRVITDLVSTLTPQQMKIQMPCPCSRCKGTNPTTSELIARLRDRHRVIICTKCCRSFPVGEHDKPLIAKSRHETECSTTRCLGPECGPAGTSELSHIATERCTGLWKNLKNPARWRYIYSLVNPGQTPPNVEFEVGLELKHSDTKIFANHDKSVLPGQRLLNEVLNLIERLKQSERDLKQSERDLNQQLQEAKKIIQTMDANMTAMKEHSGRQHAQEPQHDFNQQMIYEFYNIYRPMVENDIKFPQWINDWVVRALPGLSGSLFEAQQTLMAIPHGLEHHTLINDPEFPILNTTASSPWPGSSSMPVEQHQVPWQGSPQDTLAHSHATEDSFSNRVSFNSNYGYPPESASQDDTTFATGAWTGPGYGNSGGALGSMSHSRR